MRIPSNLPIRLVAVLVATGVATTSLKAADDPIDPRYPNRYCFWYGSCPFSGASAGQCPAPYQDPGWVSDFGQGLLWNTDRICAFTGWKNLCCEPLGSVSQDEKTATPPPSHPANTPITITRRPLGQFPSLNQPVNKSIGPHSADSRPPFGQPSNAPITVRPADPSSLNLPVRKIIGSHSPDIWRPPGEPTNKPIGPHPADHQPPLTEPTHSPVGPYPAGPRTPPSRPQMGWPNIKFPRTPYVPSPGNVAHPSTATAPSGGGAYPGYPGNHSPGKPAHPPYPDGHTPHTPLGTGANKNQPIKLGKRDTAPPTAFRATPSPRYRADRFRAYRSAAHGQRAASASKVHPSKLR
jgi:hypothetical protein